MLAANQGDSPVACAALEKLCRSYWQPLYSFVRRKGYSEADAQDLTQDFFQRLLERKYLKLADRGRGKFRTFLLNSLQHFLVNEWERAHTVKRGGGRTILSWDAATAEAQYQADAATQLTPEKLYERRWAATVLQHVLSRLREEAVAAGKGDSFEKMKQFFWGEAGSGSYAELAAAQGLTENAARVAMHRLRQRYRQLLTAEIAQTVAHPDEIEEEIRYLFRAVG